MRFSPALPTALLPTALLPTALLLAALVLAGCAALPLGPANPDRVSLLQDRLSVHFFDGTACHADIGLAASGRLPDCPQPMDYAVVVHHPVRVSGAEAFLEPYATITLTRPDTGRSWRWQTPQEADLGQKGQGAVKLF